MIKFEEAVNIVSDIKKKLSFEIINLEDCLNRVLGEDIISDINMPPFNKSAVDGFACKESDVSAGKKLKIIETVQAGQMPSKKIEGGECIQIMTGAPMPEGADKVVMVEHCEVCDDYVTVNKNQKKSNICDFAEDVKKGDIVLNIGTLLKSKHVPVLASAGYSQLKVYKKIKFGIISTGDELVEPNQKPSPSQIRNSNGPQLLAQVKELDLSVNYFGIAKDNREATYNIITKSLEENDITLLTGGVSMGKYDFVPDVFEEIGVNILFGKIAIKPGKPTVFGVYGDKYIFGLPGNPVSSFVLFEILVKPFAYQLMGHTYVNKEYQLPMGIDYKRSRDGRRSFIPIKIIDNQIFPVVYHGSGHINSLTDTDGFISVPIGVKEINKGELIHVRPI